jgi:hypothetical protein
MATRSWVRRLFAGPVLRPIRQVAARVRPRLEDLENRLAPATYST